MLTSKQCLAYFGEPHQAESKHMTVVTKDTGIAKLPKKFYINKVMVNPLFSALAEIRELELDHLIHSWDGAFNIRMKRGGTTSSLHSWGVAFDINASTNPMGKPGDMDPRLVEVFKRHGFDWGGDWSTPDSMHFQMRELP